MMKCRLLKYCKIDARLTEMITFYFMEISLLMSKIRRQTSNVPPLVNHRCTPEQELSTRDSFAFGLPGLGEGAMYEWHSRDVQTFHVFDSIFY